jgi:hypothetical protein
VSVRTCLKPKAEEQPQDPSLMFGLLDETIKVWCRDNLGRTSARHA